MSNSSGLPPGQDDRGHPSPVRLCLDDTISGVRVRGHYRREGDKVLFYAVRAWDGRYVASATFWWDSWESAAHCVRYGVVSELIRKALAKRPSDGASAGASDAALRHRAPVLHDFLTVTSLGDGEVRQTSTLLVFVEGDLWKACLNDRSSELTLWASADSLEAVLDALEERLCSPSPEWRRSPVRPHSNKSKK